MTNVCILSIIMSELVHGQKSSLIVLFSINKYKITSLYHAILPVSPAVYQWIKYSRELPLNVKKVV